MVQDIDREFGQPLSIITPVYETLHELREAYNTAKNNGEISEEHYKKRLKEQKSQARELYTYLATWGLMRLRAEEMSRNAWGNRPILQIPLPEKARKDQEGKREILERFFRCLERVSGQQNLANTNGAQTLKDLHPNNYIGLTGIALAVAREFSFWTEAIYPDIKGEETE
ncbi:MAG: hypothetical protein EAZ94_21960 [Oscillatoriales cyanobacterium]|uniref:hypothetical protein n=1 Tax=unclassified Microcoleus TaxID=2642155 RepID=UPI001DED1B93|nr:MULTISPECIES: hypothetical protein [unclassified Microcoleus]TAE09449.1 MAG: hypothetical protein EAZ94_21960 [Oscillatoriales cyanobacterium]MCC3568078.1 hypothetical protein [Microcoleus sp. PH2017_31_RDM_U_A]MCC3580357.1 hypothetical protein [Microcoleus sp. PH2017_32_RDM_D_A]MCC3618513.1 hypothetical protein [Microcoleus sp. PH2017_38_RDM_U_B]TAE19071.1 MAG: hypothetical protein EAZ93_27955 [Oscillatoriales cyanobacterium]